MSSSTQDSKYSFSTLAIHADGDAFDKFGDVAPAISVSTTFKHSPEENSWPVTPIFQKDDQEQSHVYSRYTQPTRDRLETVLGALEGGHAITYSSGLTAVYALYNYTCPKRIIKSNQGYFGCEAAAKSWAKGRSVEFLYLETFDHKDFISKPGDLILLESPQNPRNEFYDYEFWCKKRAEGAFVAVDATFAPPPLQFPLKHGVDFVMHSSTKYLGGHSDLLGGVLGVKDEKIAKELLHERSVAGWNMGNMETWLLLRSLRSLEVRVEKQSKTATTLAHWLNDRKEPELSIVEQVFHTTIPGNYGHEAAKKYMKSGAACFGVHFKSLHHARLVCNELKLFVNATSLGGVESLVEWRYPVDQVTDPKLIRISIGLEDVEDLKRDLLQAFSKVKQVVSEMKD